MSAHRRRCLFGGVTVAAVVLCSLIALLAMDIYLHAKFERTAGVNVWGYRGPVVGHKKPGEHRIVVVGGSAAFGYGVLWTEAFPAALERKLRAAAPGDRFTVVNLGYNNDGAYSLQFTLRDYAYLDYDVACVYDGYNDVMDQGQNAFAFRHTSPVFRLTGYLPIFPMVFREKAAVLLSGGDAGATSILKGKTVFHASLARRSGAEALQTAASIGEALEQQLSRAIPAPARAVPDDRVTGCRAPWNAYCESIDTAVAEVVAQHKKVLVVTQPYLLRNMGDIHRTQQHEMASMLRRRFDDRDVRYVNLGAAINLANPDLSFDQTHLTPKGNEQIAQALVDPVLDILGTPASNR